MCCALAFPKCFYVHPLLPSPRRAQERAHPAWLCSRYWQWLWWGQGQCLTTGVCVHLCMHDCVCVHVATCVVSPQTPHSARHVGGAKSLLVE